MENKLKWNESGIQKAAKRFAYPFTGFLDGKRYPPRGVSSSTAVSAFKRTNAAFFINWKGSARRLSVVMVPDDSGLLKIQNPSQIYAGPAVGRCQGRVFYEVILHFGTAVAKPGVRVALETLTPGAMYS